MSNPSRLNPDSHGQHDTGRGNSEVNVGKAIKIGPFTTRSNLIVAPMAGVTDRPFRQLCRRLGAGLAVSEMITANALLFGTKVTQRRADHEGESAPKSIQIAGSDPAMMADAARYNVDRGAQIIDINMGCPAKKICNKLAGSALLKDEKLVGRILDAVVNAVDVPVTLKIRTGWDPQNKNATTIAAIAETAGIRALAVHGRTRACKFRGQAEYHTIAAIKQCVGIPVIANGDVDTVEKAKAVLDMTGADGLMIGRAAQGNPWIFREMNAYLGRGEYLPRPSALERRDVIDAHLRDIHAFYGNQLGVRVARKHISWYTKGIPGADRFRKRVNTVSSAKLQRIVARDFFNRQLDNKMIAA